MKYMKPEIAVLDEAITAIQGAKPRSPVADQINHQLPLQSVGAYEADE